MTLLVTLSWFPPRAVRDFRKTPGGPRSLTLTLALTRTLTLTLTRTLTRTLTLTLALTLTNTHLLHPRRPKKPKTAYLCFADHHRIELAKTYPGAGGSHLPKRQA